MHYVIFFIFMAVTAFSAPISMDEVVDKAVISSVFATKAMAVTQSKYGKDIDDGNLENPKLDFDYSFGSNQREIEFSQPLRPSDISLARTRYKDLTQSLKTTSERRDLLRIYHQVSLAYVDLFVGQKELSFMRERLEYLNKVQTKKAADFDAMAAQVDVLKVSVKVKEIDLKQARFELSQKLYTNFESVQFLPPPLFVLAPVDAVLRATETLPNSFKVASENYSQAKIKTDIIHQDRHLPVFEPSISYDLDEKKADRWSASLALRLPLWNQRSGAYAAAKALQSAALSDVLRYETVSFDKTIIAQYDKLAEQINLIRLYETTILPMYQKSSDKIKQAYETQKASIDAVWEIREKYISGYRDYLSALRYLWVEKAAFEMLIGGRVEDIRDKQDE